MTDIKGTDKKILCDNYFKEIGYYWKKDSIGNNGFRWIVAHTWISEFNDSANSDCTLIGDTITKALLYLGKPNRIDSVFNDKNNEEELIYDYYTTSGHEIDNGESLWIYVSKATLIIRGIHINKEDG